MKAELQQVRHLQHGVSHFIAFVQVMTITTFTYFADHAYKIAHNYRYLQVFFYFVCTVGIPSIIFHFIAFAQVMTITTLTYFAARLHIAISAVLCRYLCTIGFVTYIPSRKNGNLMVSAILLNLCK